VFLLVNDAVSSSHIASRRSETKVNVNSNYASSIRKDVEVNSCGLERLKSITRKISQYCVGNLCENKDGKQCTHNIKMRQICATTDVVEK
jgi:hypothetical protein